jgi:poly(A) polymerase
MTYTTEPVPMPPSAAAPEDTARTDGPEAASSLAEAPQVHQVAAATTTGLASEHAPAGTARSEVKRPEGVEGPAIPPERLDADAVRVLLRLRQHGHEAFLVGGCVRDLLIGRTPKDFDLATSATPNQVRALFRNCRLIGRRFRLAHVYFKGGKILEVSTFRANPTMVEDPLPSEAAEGEVHCEGVEHVAVADQEALAAVDQGEPVPEAPVEDLADEVAQREQQSAPAVDAPEQADPCAEASDRGAPKERDLLITEDNTFGTALEDARRRDFTINGLFYEPQAGRVYDYVHGLRDLALREIRTIGDPEQRMREDPVRVLRAVRFAGKLGFDIESRTYAAMEGAVEDLSRCAPPRLLEETFRLIRGGDASPSMKLIVALDGMKTLLPPIDEYLKAQDAGGFDEYFELVAIMDGLVRSGAPFDDSMLLASILLPLALEESADAANVDGNGDEGKPVSVAAAVEALLQELVQKARLPRRIAERARMILMAQRTLAGLRRRRGGLGSFRGHPLFKESLRVFEVWVQATGEYEEALAKWKAGGSPQPAANAPGPRRRRRRRGGGAGGKAEGPAAVPSHSSDA